MSKLPSILKSSNPETPKVLYFEPLEPRILPPANLSGGAFGDVSHDDGFHGYQNIELPFIGPGQGPLQFLPNDSETEISRSATPAEKQRNATENGTVDSRVEEI